ncbi:MAG: hormogonium polysaccharide biosynthesis glycosyltransferase HpsP [Synechococcales bacterium]|nr:hormogonium polysaccharide biosynthesis glycosyltransferase HpsP [Synechococcales bacterium]
MNRPLRVLQIVPSVSLVYGGPSQMVLGLSKALATQGVEVTILTTDANGDAGQPPLAVPLNCPVAQDGYQIWYFRCAPFRRYKFSAGLLSWLLRHAHEFDLAHIHALFSPVSSLAAAIARTRHLPYILRPLGTLDPLDLQKKRLAKQLYAALLERANLAGAAALHFTSAQEAQTSHRFGIPTQDWILPLGVEPHPPTHLPIPPSPHPPTLLFLSRIAPKKGLDLLIPALEKLTEEGLEFRFILAGSNPQEPEYEQQVGDRLQSSPLASRTTITGFVTGEAKQALLHQADLFVLPSYYENFGIAVAEALAAGIPVVISDQVHIWQEVEQAEAGWVVPCEVGALAAGLRQALQNGDERGRRGQNARYLAQTRYGWRAIAQTLIAHYQTLLPQSPSEDGRP